MTITEMNLMNCLRSNKKIKLCVITFLVILGSLFFIGNVKASSNFIDLIPNQENSNGIYFTEDDINNIKTAWGIPESDDAYFLVSRYNSDKTKNVIQLYFYNSYLTSTLKSNSKYYLYLNGTSTIDQIMANLRNTSYYFYTATITVDKSTSNSLNAFLNSTPEKKQGIEGGFSINSSNTDNPTYYYTNNNIYNLYNSSWLEANNQKEPSYTYEILKNDNSLELKFNFENFNNEGYFYQLNDINNPNIIYNINPPMETYVLSLNYNTIWEFILYDNEGVVSSEVIDVTGLYEKKFGEYSVVLRRDPTHDNGNAFRYYYHSNSDEPLHSLDNLEIHCYHGTITGQVSSWYEDDCTSAELSISSTSNEVLQWKIVYENVAGGKTILYERQYAVVNDELAPFITFDVNKNLYGYDVSIIGNNMTDSHYLVYKLNNEISEHKISSGTTLSIYENTRIYAYIYSLNNTIVASSYKDIVVDLDQHTSKPSDNNNNIGGAFTDFRNSLSNFLKPINFIMSNISNFYNNYMPLPLQSFLFFIFSLTVIIIVIRIIF